MTKKLDDMWSTKWVLPEHREAINKEYHNLKWLIKPELDEQEVARIDETIQSAIKMNGTISLTVFKKYKLRTIVGSVIKIDTNIQMVKIKFEDPSEEHDECEWIPMRDILKAELKEDFDLGWE